jgi:hypothetical protein
VRRLVDCAYLDYHINTSKDVEKKRKKEQIAW